MSMVTDQPVQKARSSTGDRLLPPSRGAPQTNPPGKAAVETPNEAFVSETMKATNSSCVGTGGIDLLMS
jgi:hypothetical protein